MHVIVRRDVGGDILWDGNLDWVPSVGENVILPYNEDGELNEHIVVYVNHYPYTLQRTVEVVVGA